MPTRQPARSRTGPPACAAVTSVPRPKAWPSAVSAPRKPERIHGQAGIARRRLRVFDRERRRSWHGPTHDDVVGAVDRLGQPPQRGEALGTVVLDKHGFTRRAQAVSDPQAGRPGRADDEGVTAARQENPARDDPSLGAGGRIAVDADRERCDAMRRAQQRQRRNRQWRGQCRDCRDDGTVVRCARDRFAQHAFCQLASPADTQEPGVENGRTRRIEMIARDVGAEGERTPVLAELHRCTDESHFAVGVVAHGARLLETFGCGDRLAARQRGLRADDESCPGIVRSRRGCVGGRSEHVLRDPASEPKAGDRTDPGAAAAKAVQGSREMRGMASAGRLASYAGFGSL